MEQKRKGLIYGVKCKTNGKLYIGQTVQKLVKRKNNHKFEAFSDKARKKYTFKFYNALRKHGWYNFEWFIVEENINIKNLAQKEIFYINEYDTYKNGYNSSLGGDGQPSGESHPMFGKKHSEKAKAKMRLSHHNLKGKDHPSWGRKATDEEKLKMSISRKGKQTGRDNPMYGMNGSKNPNYNATIYKFWHPEHGERMCSAFELRQEFPEILQGNLSSLVNNKLQRYKKWECLGKTNI